jgi:beta-lactamase regulating signal transducer with metallopeptidase domain
MMFLVECALRVTAVLALALAVTLVLRRSSAALRHVVWVSAFALAAMTPLALPVGPRLVSTRLLALVPAVVEAQPAPAKAHPVTLSECLLFAWAIGVLVCAIRMGNAARQIHALRKTAILLHPAEIAERGGLPLEALVGAQIGESDSAAVAMTFGIRTPWILLPSEYYAWSGPRLRAVLLHELEHVRRRDLLVQYLPLALCALHWFNPLVWAARSRMICESERACDDAVIRSGVGGSDFARDLLEIAQSLRLKGALPMSLAITTKLERRIARLLDASANRTPLAGKRAVIATLAAGVLFAPIVLIAPKTTRRRRPPLHRERRSA